MSSYNTPPDKQYQICIFGSENYMTCYNDTPAVSLLCPKSGWSMKLQESDTNAPQYTICQNENPAAGLTVDQDPKCLNDAYTFYDISLQEIEFPVSKRQLWTLDSQLERDASSGKTLLHTRIQSVGQKGFSVAIGGISGLPRLYLGIAAVANDDNTAPKSKWTIEEVQ